MKKYTRILLTIFSLNICITPQVYTYKKANKKTKFAKNSGYKPHASLKCNKNTSKERALLFSIKKQNKKQRTKQLNKKKIRPYAITQNINKKQALSSKKSHFHKEEVETYKTSPSYFSSYYIKKLITLCLLFTLFHPAFAKCVNGYYHFEIYSNKENAIDGSHNLLFATTTKCYCISSTGEYTDRLICDNFQGVSKELCDESGLKAAKFWGPPGSGFFIRPIATLVECECYDPYTFTCFPTSIVASSMSLSINNTFYSEDTPTLEQLEKITNVIANITVPVILVSGCGIALICGTTALCCLFKKNSPLRTYIQKEFASKAIMYNHNDNNDDVQPFLVKKISPQKSISQEESETDQSDTSAITTDSETEFENSTETESYSD